MALVLADFKRFVTAYFSKQYDHAILQIEPEPEQVVCFTAVRCIHGGREYNVHPLLAPPPGFPTREPPL